MRRERNMANRMILSMLVMAVSVTGCQKSAAPADIPQDVENQESVFSFVPEQFTYHGAKLTEMQKQNMENEMDKMVEAVIDAVNTSKEQVDLSGYAQNSQIAKSALQIAAYVDPIAEIAVFEEDSNTPGVFRINYGCSIEEHQRLVKEFNEKIESIVKSCFTRSKSDTEYAAAVFQYLAGFCQYDYEDYANAREAGITAKESAQRYRQMSVYHVFMDGSGVCQQFTRAFSLLLQQVGIPALEIAAVSNVPFASNNVIYNGRTEGELFGINHMWNLMQLSGKWYGADVTFAVSAKEGTADVSEAVIYQYFGMSDETMQEHFPSDISMPAFYRGITIPFCEEELMLPEKEQICEIENIEDMMLENGQVEKVSVTYEVNHLGADGREETLMIDFGGIDAVYRLTVTLPEGYTQEKAYSVCYLLGDGVEREMTNFSSSICVKISAEAEGKETDPAVFAERDFSQEPALFLNRFLYGIMEVIENEYSVDIADRTLCSENLGANMSLYILFQSDHLACDVFSSYICVNLDLYHMAGGKSLMAWETEYFQRCQELPVSITISEDNPADSGRSSRTGLLVDIIQKREYRNLNLKF